VNRGYIDKLVVVSNQQERSSLTNDAVPPSTTFNLPFIVAKILVLPERMLAEIVMRGVM